MKKLLAVALALVMVFGLVACAGTGITAAWMADGNNGDDYVVCAVNAAERMKKNLLRYITVL